MFELLTQAQTASGGAGGIVEDGVVHPHVELAEQALRTAGALADLGVQRGDAVAIMLPAGMGYGVALLAASALGAAAMPLNPRYERAELSALLGAAGVRALVTDGSCVAKCLDALGGLGGDVPVAVMNRPAVHRPARAGGGPRIAGNDPVDLAALAAHRPPPRPVIGNDDEDAFIFHSSGSTGRSKLIRRTYAQMRAEVKGFAEAAGATPNDCFLSTVPLFHAHGFSNCLLASLHAGARLVIAPPDLSAMLARNTLAELAEQHRATILPAVPMTFDQLARARAGADLSSLRLCITAGTALAKATFDAFRARFGLPVRQLFGCSEGGALALNTAPDPVPIWDSVGRGIGDTRFRILRPDADGIGEIAVQSGNLTRGYDGLPEVNAASFVDGWFLTGDRGRLDAAGNLYVTAKRALYIETGGHKVDPYEIEDLLTAHPAVSEAAVVGTDLNDGCGVQIKAVVVASAPVTAQALRRHCAAHLAAYKVPLVIEMRESLPKSPLGKVLKKYLA